MVPNSGSGVLAINDERTAEKLRLEKTLRQIQRDLTDLLNLNDETLNENKEKDKILTKKEKQLTELQNKNQQEMDQLKVARMCLYERVDYEIEVASIKVHELTFEKERCEILSKENKMLERAIEQIKRKLDMDGVEEATEFHSMNINMKEFRQNLEKTFKNKLINMDMEFQQKAFDELDDVKKDSLYANAKMKDEIALLGVGISNLSVRLAREKNDHRLIQSEITRLSKKARLYRRKVMDFHAQLHKLQAKHLEMRKEVDALSGSRHEWVQRVYSDPQIQQLDRSLATLQEAIGLESLALELWGSRLEQLRAVKVSMAASSASPTKPRSPQRREVRQQEISPLGLRTPSASDDEAHLSHVVAGGVGGVREDQEGDRSRYEGQQATRAQLVRVMSVLDEINAVCSASAAVSRERMSGEVGRPRPLSRSTSPSRSRPASTAGSRDRRTEPSGDWSSSVGLSMAESSFSNNSRASSPSRTSHRKSSMSISLAQKHTNTDVVGKSNGDPSFAFSRFASVTRNSGSFSPESQRSPSREAAEALREHGAGLEEIGAHGLTTGAIIDIMRNDRSLTEALKPLSGMEGTLLKTSGENIMAWVVNQLLDIWWSTEKERQRREEEEDHTGSGRGPGNVAVDSSYGGRGQDTLSGMTRNLGTPLTTYSNMSSHTLASDDSVGDVGSGVSGAQDNLANEGRTRDDVGRTSDHSRLPFSGTTSIPYVSEEANNASPKADGMTLVIRGSPVANVDGHQWFRTTPTRKLHPTIFGYEDNGGFQWTGTSPGSSRAGRSRYSFPIPPLQESKRLAIAGKERKNDQFILPSAREVPAPNQEALRLTAKGLDPLGCSVRDSRIRQLQGVSTLREKYSR